MPPPPPVPAPAPAALKIDPRDNAAVALRDLAAGETVPVNGDSCLLRTPVAAKHKFACEDLETGADVTLYGVLVGRVTHPVGQGEALTTENLVHESAGYAWQENDAPAWTPPDTARWENATFDGFHRPDGSVGTANNWIVVPLVFCENRNIETLRDALLRPLGYLHASPYEALTASLVENLGDSRISGNGSKHGVSRPFPNIDGIRFLTHGLGCGGTREDARTLCGLIAGYVTHPNVAGATILSLGCENAQLSLLEEEIARRAPVPGKPILTFKQQSYPSDTDFLEVVIRSTVAGLALADRDAERKPAPLSKLTFGVECGASDGFSGISANPAIGHAADCLVALGGRAILSEFPELCGVEQEIVDRCHSREAGEKFIALMDAYAARAEAVGSALHMNPSPGNIRDGLITDAIKSAGAAKKGGTSPVIDVIDYPGWVTRDGLTLLCTPGNDLESTTALAGAHANLILFSTGLGTPTGNAVAPTIKVSTNSTLACTLPDMIDFDAGRIIDDGAGIAECGGDLLDLVVEVASGRVPTRASLLGQDDFLPWKRGVSL